MPEYVLIDMNTQRDFLDADGAVPVFNRVSVVAELRKVFAASQSYQVPLVSAVDSHRETEPPHDGFPKHCLEGSLGQRKLPFTLLQKRIFIEANNNLDLPKNLLNNYRQVIFRRRTTDLLENPKADRLLGSLTTESLLIFGVGLERSIRRLILCLLARGHSVGFIPEACGYWNETEADLTQRLVMAKGCERVPLAELDRLFKEAIPARIQRVYSKPPEAVRSRRTLAG